MCDCYMLDGVVGGDGVGWCDVLGWGVLIGLGEGWGG